MIDEQGKYIELQDFLKIIGFAQTGGQAKILIRSGKVLVDGKVETRLRRKLRDKMTIEYEDQKFIVEESKLF